MRKKTKISPAQQNKAFAQARGLIRKDAWENPATGLGTGSATGFGSEWSGYAPRDKVQLGHYFDPGFQPWPELSALFHNNALARRIVEFKPNEMFRKGYTLCVPDKSAKEKGDRYAGDSDPQVAEDAENYAKKIRLNERFLSGWIWGRLFGGNLMIMGIDDGLDPSLPANEDNIKSLRFLNNVDKRFAYAHTYFADPMAPNFGEPSSYMITNTMDGPLGQKEKKAVLIVHASRVIRFDGAPVDIIKRRQLAGWSLSVLQSVYEVLRAYDTSYQAAANLMVDAAQGVFTMKGLWDMIASNNVGDLQTRMAMVDMQRSSARSLILDESETFERKATPLSGVPEILDRFMLQISMAAQIPVNVLFGRANQGMGATGDSDFRAFYDTVASEQKTYLAPQLLKLYRLICLAKDGPTGGVVPDKMTIEFESLWQMTEAEQAAIELQYGTRDAAMVTAGVLLPEEVALSHFRKGKFDPSIHIEVAPREESLAASHDFNVQVAEKKVEEGPGSIQTQHGPTHAGVGEPTEITVAGMKQSGQDENSTIPLPGPQGGKKGETS